MIGFAFQMRIEERITIHSNAVRCFRIRCDVWRRAEVGCHRHQNDEHGSQEGRMCSLRCGHRRVAWDLCCVPTRPTHKFLAARHALHKRKHPSLAHINNFDLCVPDNNKNTHRETAENANNNSNNSIVCGTTDCAILSTNKWKIKRKN